MPQIKFSTNVVIQALALILQVVNQLAPIVPTKYQFIVLFAVAVVQALTAFLGHFSTPSGKAVPKGA